MNRTAAAPIQQMCFTLPKSIAGFTTGTCHEIDAVGNIGDPGCRCHAGAGTYEAVRRRIAPPRRADARGYGQGHDPGRAIQSDLAWTGHYNGAINGEVSERMVNAIKAFQKDNRGRQTGVLNPQERGLLATAAKKPRDNVGWKIVSDPTTGAKLGIPGRLVPQQASDADGSKWQSVTGTIQILLTRRKEEAPSTAPLAEAERKLPGRKIDYSAVKPDFFVLSGLQNQKKFYIRGQFRNSEVRILTILYDQATEGVMEPVVIAMSSAFDPFPAQTQAAGPPPRKKVEYASGIVVSTDGAIVTDGQAVEGCQSVVVAGPTPAATQAVQASADAVRSFVTAHGVTADSGKAGDAKASIVRLICLRK